VIKPDKFTKTDIITKTIPPLIVCLVLREPLPALSALNYSIKLDIFTPALGRELLFGRIDDRSVLVVSVSLS
jgi:hypothetical protein